MKYVFKLWVTGVCLILPTFGANKPKEKASQSQQDQPLRIVADEMDCDQKSNICTATGHAFAQKMNDPKNQTISAHKMVVYFEKKEKSPEKKQQKKSHEQQKKENQNSQGMGQQLSLKKIIATGDVVMADTSSVIKCDEGTYYADSETVDLEGNVSITQDKNELTGTHGHANLREETYSIKNDEGRVEGLFYQKEKSKAK
jgi:lipopolysaccharide export system protein LptA